MVVDLFSKRQKQLRGEVPDVYIYDQIPRVLRAQIYHLLRKLYYKSLQSQEYSFFNDLSGVRSVLQEEYGIIDLPYDMVYGGDIIQTDIEKLLNFFVEYATDEQALDLIEIFGCILTDEKLETLNVRLREHGLGYRHEGNQLVRIDNEYLHSEVVKQALTVLHADHFQGANEEFLSAHEHFRHGRHADCVTSCGKAFESTMKAICIRRNWPLPDKENAGALIKTCFSNGLIPKYLETEFAGLRQTLENGINTLRNNEGAHGQGSEIRTIPDHLVQYVLHLTATTIVFLAEADEALSLPIAE